MDNDDDDDDYYYYHHHHALGLVQPQLCISDHYEWPAATILLLSLMNDPSRHTTLLQARTYQAMGFGASQDLLIQLKPN